VLVSKRCAEQPRHGESELSESSDLQTIAAAMEDGQYAEDVYWAFQMLSRIKTKEDVSRFAPEAPTPGAAVMLQYAHDHPRDFFKDILPKALNRKGKDIALRDDGRKKLEIFSEIYSRIAEIFTSQRKCPLCGRGLTKHTVLFRRPQRAR
jgi:hypothetical protein